MVWKHGSMKFQKTGSTMQLAAGNFLRLVIVLSFASLLFSCSLSDKSNFFSSFEHIKTDQFNWSYGQGGIYWVSNNQVVLDAQVKNKQGIPERGLYQVNVNDGTYIKLVEIGDKEQYKYCFAENTLYIKAKNRRDALHNPEFYSIEQQTVFKKLKNGLNAPLRCKSVDKPKNDGGYLALKEEDGFIKNKYITSKEDEGHVYLTNNKGDVIKELITLPPGSKGILGRPRFLPYRDAYFGYSMKRYRQDCFDVWWLPRKTWKIDIQDVCLGSWYNNGSNIISPIRVGLFVENYSTRKPSSHVIVGSKEYKFENTNIRGASVSPKGCQVAYGYGNYRPRNGGGDYRQHLKVFNACKYIESKKNDD